MDNTVAAVVQQARTDGLNTITQFNVKDGQIRCGPCDGCTLKDSRFDARVAANTPEADQAMTRQQDTRVAEQAAPQLSQPSLQRAWRELAPGVQFRSAPPRSPAPAAAG